MQAYAAGLVEGYLTKNLMKMKWRNTVEGYCDPLDLSEYCTKLQDFVNKNVAWMRQYIDGVQGDVDPYWHQVHVICTIVMEFSP